MSLAGLAALDFSWPGIAPGCFLTAWKVWDGSEVVGRIQAPGRRLLESGNGVCDLESEHEDEGRDCDEEKEGCYTHQSFWIY